LWFRTVAFCLCRRRTSIFGYLRHDISGPETLVAFLVPLAITSPAASFDRGSCQEDVSWRLGNGTLSPDDAAFKRDKDGRSQSSPITPVLTYRGCKKLRGTKGYGMKILAPDYKYMGNPSAHLYQQYGGLATR
jgi:hypothetical protein